MPLDSNGTSVTDMKRFLLYDKFNFKLPHSEVDCAPWNLKASSWQKDEEVSEWRWELLIRVNLFRMLKR
jgi:hypothetical protein